MSGLHRSLFLLLACLPLQADTIVCLVEPMPGHASVPRLDLALLPSGFFGMKSGTPSDPVSGSIFLQSVPTGSLGNPLPTFVIQPFLVLTDPAGQISLSDTRFAGGLPQTDTIVRRLNSVVLPNIGDSGSAPIQILSLSLGSTSPLQVTYGGVNPSFFDVFVDLQPGPQPQGTESDTRTGATTGTFQWQLPVMNRLTFTNQNITGPQASGPVLRSDNFTGSGNFQIVPEPATLSTAFLGALLFFALRRK